MTSGGAKGNITVRRANGKMSRQEIDNYARNASLVLGDIAKMSAVALARAENQHDKSEKIKAIISRAYEEVKAEVDGVEGAKGKATGVPARVP